MRLPTPNLTSLKEMHASGPSLQSFMQGQPDSRITLMQSTSLSPSPTPTLLTTNDPKRMVSPSLSSMLKGASDGYEYVLTARPSEFAQCLFVTDDGSPITNPTETSGFLNNRERCFQFDTPSPDDIIKNARSTKSGYLDNCQTRSYNS